MSENAETVEAVETLSEHEQELANFDWTTPVAIEDNLALMFFQQEKLNDFTFANGVAALQATNVAFGIARECFTGDFPNAGDNFSHGTAPAQFKMLGV